MLQFIMNILLIVADNLRFDHVGYNDYNRDSTPNIDKIAHRSVNFTNATTTLARTDPAVASIMTGMYPHNNGVRFLNNQLKNNVTTIQEILKAHGYKTIGHAIELRNIGIERGFDVFNPISWRISNKLLRGIKKTFYWKQKPDPDNTLTSFGIKWIKKLASENFFIYLHYIGIHWPYHTPEPFNSLFDKNYNGKHDFNEVGGKIKRSEIIFNNTLPKREIEHAIAHYDGAISHVDYQIGRLLKTLEELKILDETLIIITADHGESFGEHKIFFDHGNYLYDEELKVPLIISHPSLPAKKIDKMVQSIDIFPTILDKLQIPNIDKTDGVSLMPLINNDEDVRKYSFSESGKSYFKENKRRYIDGVKGKWRSIRTNEWKLIYIPHPEKDIFELYNIKKDPSETENLIDSQTEIFDELRKKLLEWMKDEDEEADINIKTKSKKFLKKLGYIE